MKCDIKLTDGIENDLVLKKTDSMQTKQYNTNLSEEEKLSLLKEAKGGTWYDGWRPYCCVPHCNSRLNRMLQESYGFKCQSCGNLIGWNLERLKESPLNL